jgi:hypothetical protein
LKRAFDERVIRKSYMPPRSPDITTDFLLWGYLKDKTYRWTTHGKRT